METSKVGSPRTLEKTGASVADPLVKKDSYSEEQERLIILGKTSAELAHQLKNLFDGIRRFLSLSITCLDDKEKAAQYILNASSTLDRAGFMAESLLSFVRRESITVNKSDFPIHLTLLEILRLYEGKAKANSVQVVTHWDENCNLSLPGDFYHVFQNLIKNAIEAMPVGGVLRVVIRVENGCVEVSIEDTGVGIPERLRDKLFKSFFTTKGKDGAGLGLILSKEIVERYGGTISFKSQAEKGSAFNVIVPLK